MTRRIVQRRAARQDILDIVAYIAADNPNAAQALYDAYEHALETLAASPEIGRLYRTDNPELRGIRAWQIGRFRAYLIFYRPEGDAIEVIRVLHGRRDIQAILHDEGEG